MRKRGSNLQGLELNFLLFLQLNIAVTADKGGHKQYSFSNCTMIFIEVFSLEFHKMWRVASDILFLHEQLL